MKFADLRLAEPMLRALADEKYEIATPIQAKAIPLVLDGRDVLGCAQTGTGKTAAFALPILQRISGSARPAKGYHPPRVLVLCPTRELATQINDGFRAYGRHVKVSSTVIFGGVGQNPQVDAVRRGVDIIVATPGRLLDLINQRFVDLKAIETLVLDEADRMLDMGFINDIRKICALLPNKRQTLLFSATMPFEIRKLADSLMHNPVEVSVTPVSTVAANIDESVYFVEKSNKGPLLAALYEELAMARTIVFTRTKHGADKVVKQLHRFGIRAEAIHGNKSQNARQRALDNFKSGKTPILIATDIASRGIDVDMITHVVNYDLTHEPETYVHRIGRTARAGASGAAVSFCDHEERSNLRAIEKLVKRSLRVVRDLPALPHSDAPAVSEDREPRGGGHRDQRGGGGGGFNGGGGGGGGRSNGPAKAHPHRTGGGVRSAGPREPSHAPRAPHAGDAQRRPAAKPAHAASHAGSAPRSNDRAASGFNGTATAPRPLGGRHQQRGGGNSGGGGNGGGARRR